MDDFNKRNISSGAKAALVAVLSLIACISVSTILNAWVAGEAVEAFTGWAGVVNFLAEGFLIFNLAKKK